MLQPNLTVIIVSYNVRHFLEQALISVYKASEKINVEVIVVDNHSVDGSAEMVRQRFPQTIIIANQNNQGFSKANNQGIAIAKGKYILLLNPDTIVEEDTFVKCLSFMDNNPFAGGLGVKMVDGAGKFLPESKRGLPTPWVALSKMLGLGILFPKSKLFNHYHLGYLDINQTSEVEVLSGAFMMLNTKVIAEIGPLDEDFFMYGEDIDLSYRILKAGYKNYYYPKTTIVHYKGESTKKASINYVFVFYNAMQLFANKHFSRTKAGTYFLLIKIAIYLRASISIVRRLLRKIALPFADYAVTYTGLYLLKYFWEENVLHREIITPNFFLFVVIPFQVFLWLISGYFSGVYDKPYKSAAIIRAALIGTILVSAASNFIDIFRYSKGMIVVGGLWFGISLLTNRVIKQLIQTGKLSWDIEPKKKAAIVGSHAESQRIMDLIGQATNQLIVLGYIDTQNANRFDEECLGNAERLAEIVDIYKIDEIIFAGKDISSSKIIGWMANLNCERSPNFKIVPVDSNYIIGSSSANSRGNLYTVEVQLKLSLPMYLRDKRLFDILASVGLILTAPILLPFIRNPKLVFGSVFKVLFGLKSWLGPGLPHHLRIKRLRQGVFTPFSHLNKTEIDLDTAARLDLLYARNYAVWDDLNLLLLNLFGR